jgi:hypothetical protein
VANQRAAKPPASKAVFVNCPFDDGFKPIFRAMVFAIIWSGYYPRCALDATDGAEISVSKITKMIGECDWGIHDLSRVEVDAGGVPRFNMPMELGLYLGARLLGSGRHRRKRALILEAQPHRYDAALADISGQDIAPQTYTAMRIVPDTFVRAAVELGVRSAPHGFLSPDSALASCSSHGRTRT